MCRACSHSKYLEECIHTRKCYGRSILQQCPSEIYSVLYEEETWQTDAVESKSKQSEPNEIKGTPGETVKQKGHQCGLR